MSSYVNFYVRVDEKFAPVGSWSRSGKIYQALERRVPYEKIMNMTSDGLERVINSLELEKKEVEEYIAAKQSKITMIMNEENTPLNEKLEAVESVVGYVNEAKEEIKDYEYAINILNGFTVMIEDYRWSNNQFSNDGDHYLYVGIDGRGTLEDVYEV